MGPRVEASIQSESTSPAPTIRRHVIAGLIAGFSLVIIYAGVLTLAQGTQHALEQTASLWYWILALIVGFGIQVGLFSFIRQRLRDRRMSLSAGLATSGGVSAGSMVACCAHHLSDVLPLLGLSGLAAFLLDYQLFFIIVGVMANLVGITIMMETIQRHGLSPVLVRLQVNMSWVKKATMISAGLVILVTFIVTI